MNSFHSISYGPIGLGLIAGIALLNLTGCATPLYKVYSGQDAATIELTAGGASGFTSNALAKFGCHITDIDGKYHGHNEKIQIAPGEHAIVISWSQVTSPVGARLKSISGKKVLFLDVQPGTKYEVLCVARRTMEGYFAIFSLKDEKQHRSALCDAANTSCIEKGLK